MPKHIARLVLLIVGALVFGLSAKAYFTVDSFYVHGHFRADSVAEIAAPEPAYRGPAYCSQCHTERHTQWSSFSHKTVKCEICHGPARSHPIDPADDTKLFKLPRPSAEDTKSLCTQCHLKLTARPQRDPAPQPWDSDVGKPAPWTKGVSLIVPEEHSAGEPCLTCHDPHQPKPIRVKEASGQAALSGQVQP